MKPHAALAFALALPVALLACGGTSGAPGGDAGAPDSGTPDSGASTTPITERSMAGATHDCRVARDKANLKPLSWANAPALVTTTGGAVFLARLESTSTMVGAGSDPKLVVGKLAADGTLGAPVTVPTAGDAKEVTAVSLAPRGDGFALLFVEAGKLRFAGFDEEGAMAVAPREVTAGLDALSTARLAASASGFGVVYSTDLGGGVRDARFLALDTAGAVLAGPRRLDAPSGETVRFANPGASIVADASGYALLWRDPGSASGGIDFARAGFDGAKLTARRRVASSDGMNTLGAAAGFDPAATALVDVTGGGYLAAWTEIHGSMSFDKGAWSGIRVAALAPDGSLRRPPVWLRAPADSIDEVEPAFTRYGDSVAVTWGRGSHIYICGGCVPDHRVDFLLVDPVTLDPRSAVATLASGGTPGNKLGGLLRRGMTRAGDDFLTAFLITFHVHAEPGTATFACSKKPGGS